jgi:hypothetical protein
MCPLQFGFQPIPDLIHDGFLGEKHGVCIQWQAPLTKSIFKRRPKPFDVHPDTGSRDASGELFLPHHGCGVLRIEAIRSNASFNLRRTLWQAGMTSQIVEQNAERQRELEAVLPTMMDEVDCDNLFARSAIGARAMEPVDDFEMRPARTQFADFGEEYVYFFDDW